MSVVNLLSYLKRAKPTGASRRQSCYPEYVDEGTSLSILKLKDGRVVLQFTAGSEEQSLVPYVELCFEGPLPPHDVDNSIDRELQPPSEAHESLSIGFAVAVVLKAGTSILAGKTPDVDPVHFDLAVKRILAAMDAGDLDHG